MDVPSEVAPELARHGDRDTRLFIGDDEVVTNRLKGHISGIDRAVEHDRVGILVTRGVDRLGACVGPELVHVGIGAGQRISGPAFKDIGRSPSGAGQDHIPGASIIIEGQVGGVGQ